MPDAGLCHADTDAPPTVATHGWPALPVVAAGLSQIGELSFILAELGRPLTLNPALFRPVDPLAARLARQQAVVARAAEPEQAPP